MKKIFSFSLLLILGLVASQILPGMLGESYPAFRAGATTFLYVCLSFIMINVGREFEIDKKRWCSYAEDYFIAMATAAVPWLLIALYYVFVLLPPEFWGNGDAWKENLLLSRFAAPTSAGILFTMLAALRLKRSWMYRKIQVLAIFDDLDTILLMIPLQILMIGLRWQLFVVVVIVFLLLWLGWKKLSTYELRQDWWAILTYSVVVFGVTQLVYLLSKYYFGEEGSIHIEVLLPAFVLGMVMKTRHVESRGERMAASGISFLFMFLVGLSMPLFIGMTAATGEAASSVTGSQPMMSWGTIAVHVLIVSLLANLRLSLSIGGGYSVLAFTFSGLTFPIMAMWEPMQWVSKIFPFTFYTDIFVDQMLRGTPWVYSLPDLCYMSLFIVLPLLCLPRLKRVCTEEKFWGRL